MSAYFIANIRIQDEAAYAQYVANSDRVFGQYKGKYLTVDNNPTVLEGNWPYTRLVLIEFPDKEALMTWYQSDAYQEILKYRLEGADCDTIVVESD